MSYPFGTYAAAVHHGQPVESEPPPGALIAMPGPLLEDLQLEDSHREQSFALVQEVKAAFSEEAEEIAAEYELTTTESTAQTSATQTSATQTSPTQTGTAQTTVATAPDDEPEERPAALVRHRFERRKEEPARRIVVLRDRRKGRPRSRHGSDPPD